MHAGASLYLANEVGQGVLLLVRQAVIEPLQQSEQAFEGMPEPAQDSSQRGRQVTAIEQAGAVAAGWLVAGLVGLVIYALVWYGLVAVCWLLGWLVRGGSK